MITTKVYTEVNSNYL